MRELSLEEEYALTYIWNRRDEIPGDLSGARVTPAMVALSESGYIRMQTDMSWSLAFVQTILPPGRGHYAWARKERKGFRTIRDSADELLLALASEDARLLRQDKEPLLSYHEGHIQDYRQLQRQGLVDIKWADDRPWTVTLTDDGRAYANGDFDNSESEPPMNVEVKPIFNNVINNQPTNANSASATTSISDVTLSNTIAALFDLDIDEGTRDEAEEAVKELDKASKGGNGTKLAEKIENAARIAKSGGAIAGVILPYILKALEYFQG